jgi:hypothetical protein
MDDTYSQTGSDRLGTICAAVIGHDDLAIDVVLG